MNYLIEHRSLSAQIYLKLSIKLPILGGQTVVTYGVMDQTENEGNTAYFQCQATSQPVSTISWYFNGIIVDEANTMKYTISMMTLNTTTTRNVLTIMNVQSSDVGTYTCNATNVVSSDTSSGVLTVNGELFEFLISISGRVVQ